MNVEGEQEGVGGMRKNRQCWQIWPKSTRKMQMRSKHDEVSNKHSSRGMRGGKAATAAYSTHHRRVWPGDRPRERRAKHAERIEVRATERRNYSSN